MGKNIKGFEQFVNESAAAENMAETLMTIENDIWTELGIGSGSELRKNETKQVKYIQRLEKELEKLDLKEIKRLGKEIFSELESENYHTLNVFLVMKDYIVDKRMKQYLIDTSKREDSYDNTFVKNLLK